MRWTTALLALAWTLGCLLCQGCSQQAWYEGLKSREKQECSQLPSTSEVQRCLENIPGSYDQYRYDREQERQKRL